jgi:site-specific recombinase XerD
LEKENLTNLLPHELNSDHIWRYRVFLSREKQPTSGKTLKKNTQNYYLIALRALLNYFAARDIVSLPAEKIKLAKEAKEKKVKFLTLEQVEKLLAAPDTQTVSGLRDRAILETLFSTGMRIAELVNLNKEQIKIDPQSPDLELAIIGKGEMPRTVYLSERALFWLKKYLETRNDKEKALFINYRAPKGADKRLTSRYIEKMIKNYAIKAGVPLTTTPHVLRHTFASNLLSQGVDLRTIQEFLGHRNISATQIYTHITSKRLREIHRKIYGNK